MSVSRAEHSSVHRSRVDCILLGVGPHNQVVVHYWPLSARRASVQPGGPISEVLFVYFAYLRRDRMGQGGDQIKCCDSVIFTVAVDSTTSPCLFKQQSD